MIDLTLKQPLVEAPSARKDGVSPGLLQVLQQIIAFRFLLTLLTVAVLFFVRPPAGIVPGEVRWFALISVIESGLLLAFVSWRAMRKWWGSRFLPLALGWLLLVPLVQSAIVLATAPPEMLNRIGRVGPGGIGIEAIWLAVPVVLAAWQYGRRGWRASMLALLIGQALLILLVRDDVIDLWLYVVAAIGRLGMVALLGYVVMRMVMALRSEHDALLAANRQLAKRAATVEQLAESRERNRLARELHDTLAHALSGLSVQLQALATLMDHDPAAARTALQEAQETVRIGLQEARRAIQALRATPLADLGLLEALRQLCQNQSERTGIDVRCHIEDVEAQDPLTEQTIYRIAEAALANVEEHSGAQLVNVSLTHQSDGVGLRLKIADDGVGFEPAHVPNDRFGLSGMSERAALIGATLDIDSAPGWGTRISLETKT
jgi:signal transduction histidine kinase